MTDDEQASLIQDIATKAGTIRELCEWYELTRDELQTFYDVHRQAVETFGQPKVIDDLWISNKFERLKRYQTVADTLENHVANGGLSSAELSTCVREFRSYLMLAANELGQLMHRGAGETGMGEELDVRVQGVNMEALK